MNSCVAIKIATRERRGAAELPFARPKRSPGRPPSICMMPMRARDRRVSSMRVLRLLPLSAPNEAITAMDQSDSAHWIFINKDNRRVTAVVCHRKPDKTFGVVESIS